LLNAYHRQYSKHAGELDIINYIKELVKIYRKLLVDKALKLKETLHERDVLTYFEDTIPALVPFQAVFYSIISSTEVKAAIAGLKLLFYVGYIVRKHHFTRRYNGAIKKITQFLDREAEKIRKVTNNYLGLLDVMYEYVGESEVKEYINSPFHIIENSVRKLALELRKTRETVYGKS